MFMDNNDFEEKTGHERERLGSLGSDEDLLSPRPNSASSLGSAGSLSTAENRKNALLQQRQNALRKQASRRAFMGASRPISTSKPSHLRNFSAPKAIDPLEGEEVVATSTLRKTGYANSYTGGFNPSSTQNPYATTPDKERGREREREREGEGKRPDQSNHTSIPTAQLPEDFKRESPKPSSPYGGVRENSYAETRGKGRKPSLDMRDSRGGSDRLPGDDQHQPRNNQTGSPPRQPSQSRRPSYDRQAGGYGQSPSSQGESKFNDQQSQPRHHPHHQEQHHQHPSPHAYPQQGYHHQVPYNNAPPGQQPYYPSPHAQQGNPYGPPQNGHYNYQQPPPNQPYYPPPQQHQQHQYPPQHQDQYQQQPPYGSTQTPPAGRGTDMNGRPMGDQTMAQPKPVQEGIRKPQAKPSSEARQLKGGRRNSKTEEETKGDERIPDAGESKQMEVGKKKREKGVMKYDPTDNQSVGELSVEEEDLEDEEEEEDIDVVPPPQALDLSNMKKFLMAITPRACGTVQCYIERNKNGTKKMFPEYHLFLKDGDRFLMASKKRAKNRTSNYILSMNQHDLNRESTNYLGKLRSNFLGTEFTIYDKGVNPKNSDPDSLSSSKANGVVRQELAVCTYASNVLGSRGPRKMKVAVPKVEEDGSREPWRPVKQSELMMTRFKDKDMTGLVKLSNKPPRWNESVGAYVLNFNGRVTMASVKNFQLVTPDDEDRIVLQFGRVGKDLFTMDFQFPLSPFQAFAICLSSFDNKLACE